jgi:3-oxoacyl-[acyl-carrier-protein] synthase II
VSDRMDNLGNRVVVAGVGAVTAEGLTADALWAGVRSGRVAITPVRQLPMQGFGTLIGGEVQLVYKPEHEYRRPPAHREPYVDFCLRAAEEAMASVSAVVDRIGRSRWAVVTGTCTAGVLSGEDWYAGTLEWGTKEPGLVLLVPPHALAEALAGAFALTGPALSLNTACATGSNVIGYAGQLIRSGHADAVLAAGSDCLSDLVFAGFSSLESLSPESAAPFSLQRRGLSLGEGAGAMVLMRADLAADLGIEAAAELRGYGLSADGYHPTAPQPEGEGAARAIVAALRAAGVEPQDVDYVNAHGTGTPKNDSAETNAIRVALGDAANRVAVSSTKSMIGHLLGAAGMVEGVVTVRALQEQVAPPTANFLEGDPDCDLDYVPNRARAMPMDVAISNNFGFGGANACVVFARQGALAEPPPPLGREEVVITGVAALTAAGPTSAEAWAAFAEERVCVSEEDGYRLGRVDLEATSVLAPRERRRMDRLGVLTTIAAHDALADSGIQIDQSNRGRIGIVFGTGLGPVESNQQFLLPLLEEGPGLANPAVFPNTVYNAAAGHAAIRLGAVGPSTTVTSGHAAGAHALSYGFDLVSQGVAEAAICVAADALCDLVVQGYRELGLLSAKPGRLAIAEGAAALVLERKRDAVARGARIYGQVLGYAVTCDARGIGRWDRSGKGVETAIAQALERAGLQPGDVGAVWASGAGLEALDRGERRAIARIFDRRVSVEQSGRIFGEVIGAGGALASVLVMKSAEAGRNSGGVALVNSRSMGGTNFCLALAPASR